MTVPFRAVTLTSGGGLLRVLITPCHAGAAFDAAVAAAQPMHPFNAIWDTGATHSVITQDVANTCGLRPTGMKQVYGVHGAETVETFLINIQLPNNVGFANVEVTKGQLRDAHMLIGMDIITRGDFSITNVGNRTVFSFRVPSIATVDFVQHAKTLARPKHGVRTGKHRRGK